MSGVPAKSVLFVTDTDIYGGPCSPSPFDDSQISRNRSSAFDTQHWAEPVFRTLWIGMTRRKSASCSRPNQCPCGNGFKLLREAKPDVVVFWLWLAGHFFRGS